MIDQFKMKAKMTYMGREASYLRTFSYRTYETLFGATENVEPQNPNARSLQCRHGKLVPYAAALRRGPRISYSQP